MFFEVDVLENPAIFTGEQLEYLFDKVVGLQLYLKKIPTLKTSFFIETFKTSFFIEHLQ